MRSKRYNVLVLCTGNSARSILGEVLFNVMGAGRIQAYSAGSKPAGKVNPGAQEWLQAHGHETDGLRSKSWDEFAGEDAPQFDFVFTVCDNAAGEVCPVWYGAPVTAHWGIPDPAHIEGEEARRIAFNHAAEQLTRRIQLFLHLLRENLPPAALQSRLDEIGKIED